MDAFTEVGYAVGERIATITLNRPAARNGYTVTMADELLAAFDRADGDEDVRVVVFTGAGEHFCVGADLSGGGFSVTGQGAVPPDWQEPAGRASKRIFAMNKPVIAALRGAAVGAGSTIVLSCDYRIASTDSRFGFVFSRRGIYPEGGSAWYLPRLVGLGTALDWMISGRVFGAEEALSAGLVRELHAPDDVLPAAYALAEDLVTTTAPVSTAVIRHMLYHLSALDSPLRAHEVDSRLIAGLPSNPDAIEGVLSFLEKRAPHFPGTVPDDLPSWLPWTAATPGAPAEDWAP